jgi:ankyrin repeat protein
MMAELKKNEEKTKLLSEREKLMEILAKGREKKNQKILDSKVKEFEEKQRIMEEKWKEREEKITTNKLEQMLAVDTTPVADTADTCNEAEVQHEYTKQEMEDYLRGFFAPYDPDWTGYITSDDFHSALLSFPDGPSDAVATQLVKSVEKDGYCGYEEFVQNYIREIGIQDEPYNEENYQQQQQQQQQEEEAEEYHDPYAIPCAYCIDQEGTPATHTAAAYGHVECLEAYLNGTAESVAPKGALDSNGRTALFCACAANQFNCVALLLQDDDSPAMLDHQDFRGDTAVHATSVNGHTACLQLLLQSGAEVDIPNRKGQLATHLARNAECMQTLMDHSGDIFGVDHVGRTTVFVACSNGRESALHCLLDLDEDALMLNLPDDRGDTPLHACCCNGHVSCVRLLLQTMADPSILNNQSLIPGYLAECNGHIDVVSLLEEYGGYKRQTDMAGAISNKSKPDPNWSSAVDEHGTIYYWHHETGESRWEPPDGWVPQDDSIANSHTSPHNASSPQHYASPTASTYGSPTSHYDYGGGDEGYWGGNANDENWGNSDTQQWGDWATEGYDYTNEWEEYWQWYGYEQQEEAPRYYEENEEWIGYYDEAGNWIDTSAETHQQHHQHDAQLEGKSDVPEQSQEVNDGGNDKSSIRSELIPRKLNKNYDKMAKDYSFQAPYRVSKFQEKESNGDAKCMVCHKEHLSTASVLLPCEHRSVCNACIEEHGYGITSRKASANVGGGIIKLKPKQCPACKKRVYKVVTLQKFFTLPRDYGPAPRLAKHFAESFKNAGLMLRDGNIPNAVAIVVDKTTSDSNTTIDNDNHQSLSPTNNNNEDDNGKKKTSEKKSPNKAKIPLVVTFGEGPIGLELVPIPNKNLGSIVKSVNGAALEANVKPKMKLLKVNNDKVDQIAFGDLMKLLQKSKRPIKMLFLM